MRIVRAPSLTRVALLVFTVACSCVSVSREGEAPDPPGPPVVELSTVRSHARQFDEEVPVREPGSQEEFIASSYILGHLQQAGYAPLLDAVPVANLVRSTNVVAAPPDGEAARHVVTVAYDARGVADARGVEIGLWLELARAISVASPGHDVEFVALGAQTTADRRGSSRLASFLSDREGEPPVVITLRGIGDVEGRSLTVAGELEEELAELARAGRVVEEEGDFASDPALFEAGVDEVVVGGDAEEVGRVLLDYLTRR